MLGDPTRLRQMVWHLLVERHQVHAARRRGRHRRSSSPATAAMLTVSDSGPGIDPEFLPRIFDRFTQEDPSPTRTAGGLGVGLSLVRDLVELHGGEIRARNRDGGSGAVFTARFPLQRRRGRGQEVAAVAADAASDVAAARRPARAGARSGCRRPRSAAHGAAAARRRRPHGGLGRRCARVARSLAAGRPGQRQRVARARLVRAGRQGAVARGRPRRTDSRGRADRRSRAPTSACGGCWTPCSATCRSRSSRRC